MNGERSGRETPPGISNLSKMSVHQICRTQHSSCKSWHRVKLTMNSLSAFLCVWNLDECQPNKDLKWEHIECCSSVCHESEQISTRRLASNSWCWQNAMSGYLLCTGGVAPQIKMLLTCASWLLVLFALSERNFLHQHEYSPHKSMDKWQMTSHLHWTRSWLLFGEIACNRIAEQGHQLLCASLSPQHLPTLAEKSAGGPSHLECCVGSLWVEKDSAHL